MPLSTYLSILFQYWSHLSFVNHNFDTCCNIKGEPWFFGEIKITEPKNAQCKFVWCKPTVLHPITIELFILFFYFLYLKFHINAPNDVWLLLICYMWFIFISTGLHITSSIFISINCTNSYKYMNTCLILLSREFWNAYGFTHNMKHIIPEVASIATARFNYIWIICGICANVTLFQY